MGAQSVQALEEEDGGRGFDGTPAFWVHSLTTGGHKTLHQRRMEKGSALGEGVLWSQRRCLIQMSYLGNLPAEGA